MRFSRFSEWCFKVRNKKAITQEALTELVEKYLPSGGVSTSFISNVENGRRIPSPPMAAAIAAALGYPKPLGLFLAGYVPSQWLEGEIDKVQSRFYDLHRFALGSPNIINSVTRGDDA